MICSEAAGLGLCGRNCDVNTQPPNTKTAPSAKAPDEFKRPATGLGSKESLDGDSWAWGCRAQAPTQAHCHRPHRPTPPVGGQLLQAAGARPAETSQERSPRVSPPGAGGEEAGCGGV